MNVKATDVSQLELVDEEDAPLSEARRAELVASLEEGEREIAAGRGIPYSTSEARAAFMRGFEKAKAGKRV